MLEKGLEIAFFARKHPHGTRRAAREVGRWSDYFDRTERLCLAICFFAARAQEDECPTGGGSDANFTAALGIPTLDGLRAVGEGAHAMHESILDDRIPDRVALLAKLVAGLASSRA